MMMMMLWMLKRWGEREQGGCPSQEYCRTKYDDVMVMMLVMSSMMVMVMKT